MTTDIAKDGAPAEQETGATDAPELRVFVMALFFIFGGITSLNDVIIPKLKELFSLDHMQAMLVQSAFFAAYFVISLPGAALVRRLGYMRGAAVGLLTMMAGCLLFIPGLGQRHLRPVPGRAVRAGERDHHRAGGGQSAHLAAGAEPDRAQPADLRPGVQFAGHDGLSLFRLDPDPRPARRRERRAAFGRGARRLSRRRDASRGARLFRACRWRWRWSRARSGSTAIACAANATTTARCWRASAC